MGPDAHLATRRVGQRMVQDEVRWLGAKAEELLADYERERPQARLATFAQVEEIWRDVVVPAAGQFRSIQDAPEGFDIEPVPAGSRWAENLAVPAQFV